MSTMLATHDAMLAKVLSELEGTDLAASDAMLATHDAMLAKVLSELPDLATTLNDLESCIHAPARNVQ